MFTQAQTVVTNLLVQEIQDNPQAAFGAQALPMLTETKTCEQVHFLGMNRDEQMPVFEECAERATKLVEWNERDMQPTSMFMCDAHADHFLEEDIPTRDDVTYTYVQSL